MHEETSPATSLDERKLSIEMAKLELEQRKLKLEETKTAVAIKSYRIDLAAKLAIPVAVLILAAATYSTNSSNNDARMVLEVDKQKKDFSQKQEELFIKRSDVERNRMESKARFIQNNQALIFDPAPESVQKVTLLAKAMFSKEDLDDILEKVSAFRIDTPPRQVEADKPSPLKAAAEYIATGKRFTQKGNYAQALVNFEMATLLNTSDAMAWNYKAYAEMRTERNDAALKSISTAINLQPVESGDVQTIVINATKILCSLGRTEDARSYINKSLAIVPQVVEKLRGDRDFATRCNFTFSS